MPSDFEAGGRLTKSGELVFGFVVTGSRHEFFLHRDLVSESSKLFLRDFESLESFLLRFFERDLRVVRTDVRLFRFDNFVRSFFFGWDPFHERRSWLGQRVTLFVDMPWSLLRLKVRFIKGLTLLLIDLRES